MKSEGSRQERATLSLKARLGMGAALLGVGTLLTAAILFYAMAQVADRLDAALASETRMARYATLSQQAATFLVVATEAVQTGQTAETRMERIDPVVNQIRQTITFLRTDVEDAVRDAEEIGIDEQSRYGTQSLGIARMEAMLESTLSGLAQPSGERITLRAHIDSFASNFDPLLNQAVNTEVLFRNEALNGIEELRRMLTTVAAVIATITVALVAGFYFGLIRPQFRRLDELRAASARIGQEDFGINLPDTSSDEIGLLYSETNRLAATLQLRRDEVAAEWDRLNDVIAQRTHDLREANAQLEEIDENRRRLFADISHELRTPLTVILMEAQLGLKGASDSEEAFRTIEARSSRLNRRIDDLLRVARSDTGELGLEIEGVPLPRIAVEVREEISAELDNAGLDLLFGDFPDVHVQCDPNWLRQTIVSLVRNTIRHARNGRSVRLSPIVEGEMAGISVTDGGPGVPEEDQLAVFERFRQGVTGNAQGFGVGLALAKWVTEAQGGRITLESPVARDTAIGDAPGTKIAVRLPRADH